jgi:hypothetical protein
MEPAASRGPVAAQPKVNEPNQTKARALRPDDWFEEVTADSGVAFTYRSGVEGEQFTILETVGGGVALTDFDGDGALDLFFPGGGTISKQTPPQIDGLPPALYRNLGEWKFIPVPAAARLTSDVDYTHGCIAADYDRDGHPDLFVTAYGRCRLFHNLGDGTFADVSEVSGVSFRGWSTAAAWGDVDGDGWLDLYVAQYLDWRPAEEAICRDGRTGERDVCPPQKYKPAADRLFRNRRDGTFEDVSAAAGLSDQGKGLGVVASDLDGDGRIDFYVANDAGANHLYLGRDKFPLQESAAIAGVAYSEQGLPEGSMGVDVADYNGDERADLWVTNFELEDNSLYQGEADGLFRHATVSAGLAGLGFAYVGFGTGFDDLDGDGRPDLFVCNGHVFYRGGQSGYEQPAFLFRNRNGERFENVTDRGGPYFSVPHRGRGAALGDLDNDGDLDLVIVHQNQPASLLKNRREAANWVRLRLRGTSQNSDAIGARVRLAEEGVALVRWVRSGAGYLSQFDQRILLPAEHPVAVTVTWPGGRQELFEGLSPGRTHEIVEGAGQAVPSAR